MVAAVVPGAAVASRPQASVVSADPADFTPTLEPDLQIERPKIYALAHRRGTVYAGGLFRTVTDSTRATTLERRNLMAFDADTGAVTTLATSFDGTVWTIEARGSALYVGGSFRHVNGIARQGLVKLDAATGAVDRTFDARLRAGRVSQIAQVDHRLLIGGSFGRRLLAVRLSSGRDTGYIKLPIQGSVARPSNIRTEVFRFAVNRRHTRLVAVGNFVTVDGLKRRRAFMLNLGEQKAGVNRWYYPPLNHRCRSHKPIKSPYLEDVDFSPDGDYFVLVATGFIPRLRSDIGTAVCDAAARFETDVRSPSRPTWINYTGGDTLHSVAATGAAVYVQGHNRWLDNPYGRNSAGPGAVWRRGLGAIDPQTGKALAWDPDKPAKQGGYEFLATGAGLYVGSDSPEANHEYHRGLAFFPLD